MPTKGRKAQEQKAKLASAATKCSQPIAALFSRQRCTSNETQPEPENEVALPELDSVEVEGANGESNSSCTPAQTQKRKQGPDLGGQSAKKAKKDGGHKVGYQTAWAQNYPDIICVTETDSEGIEREGLYCKLCKKHSMKGKNGSTAWAMEPYRYLREDKIRHHIQGDQHKCAMMIELEQNDIREVFTREESEKIEGIAEMHKIMLFIARHNLPHTTMFSELVELVMSIDRDKLSKVKRGKNQSYTGQDSIQKHLQTMSQDIEDKTVDLLKTSPCPVFGLAIDEGSSMHTVTKHLGAATKYINKDGDAEVMYLFNNKVTDGKAETMTTSIRDYTKEHDISLKNLGSLSTDGASVMMGRRNGVGARLAADSDGLVTLHCNNHRLALAAKQAFADVPGLHEIELALDELFKFYHYSPNRSERLKLVQQLYDKTPLVIKQAKHFRWLSYDNAITSLRLRYVEIVEDLENTATASTDGVEKSRAKGVLRKLKKYKTLQCILMLSDVLPLLSALSKAFQARVVDLSIIPKKWKETQTLLESLKSGHGTFYSSRRQVADKLGFEYSVDIDESFQSGVLEKFITAVVRNVGSRLEQPAVVEALAALDLTDVESDSLALHGLDAVDILADHFSFDKDALLAEWCRFQEVMEGTEMDKTINNICKHFCNSDSLQTSFPSIFRLYCVAGTLAISTAEVERLFSHMKLVVTEHRARLSAKNLDHILRIKLNGHLLDVKASAKMFVLGCSEKSV